MGSLSGGWQIPAVIATKVLYLHAKWPSPEHPPTPPHAAKCTPDPSSPSLAAAYLFQEALELPKVKGVGSRTECRLPGLRLRVTKRFETLDSKAYLMVKE